MYALIVTSFVRAAVFASASGTLSACGVVVDAVDETGVVVLPWVPIVEPPDNTSQYQDIVVPVGEWDENVSVAAGTASPVGIPRLPSTSRTYLVPLNATHQLPVVYDVVSASLNSFQAVLAD